MKMGMVRVVRHISSSNFEKLKGRLNSPTL